jgi:indolepyruvate ferredoxin oxidoreductase beta subunit
VPDEIANAFPAATHDIVAAGHARLVDYQGASYAELYLRRLARVLAAERASAAAAEQGFALTRETARFLALWMAFDDIVRVAQIKCRASRFARVRSELGAGDGDVVRIVDYFKPRVPEIAGLLPDALARRLLRWDRKRRQRGRESFALPLRVRTDGVVGFCILRALSTLRGMRKRGARYAEEQAMIERWLSAVEDGARVDWSLAYEIALCGRLIKGYGATNERGKANLSHILDQLVERGSLAANTDRATAIRSAREAALADEGGNALDRALTQHGVAPRPIVAQPIRWTRPARSAGEHRAA